MKFLSAVALDVEIWPTSITLAAGERLVMRVRASDDDLGVISHNDPHDRGDLRSFTTTIHTGGRFDSALLAPVIPPDLEVLDPNQSEHGVHRVELHRHHGARQSDQRGLIIPADLK